MADEVRVVEVLLRDGLQTLVHESGWHSPTTGEKLDLIRRISDTGVPEIEVTGFVHPKVIPMLADAGEIVAGLPNSPRTTYRALVPNLRGAERAAEAGCTKVSCLIVASETYSRKNSNMSVNENLEQIKMISDFCGSAGITVSVGMGICFLCPYEGVVPEESVLRLIDEFTRMGINEVSIADSIGMTNPRDVSNRVAAIKNRWPEMTVGVHLHERNGMALANVLAAYQSGATVFESCLCGYGGGIAMPVSVLGMGNVPTEDVVHMFSEMGVHTGIDLAAIRAASAAAAELIGIPSRARLAQVGTFSELNEMAQQFRSQRGHGASA
jgi:hydroxymethylglutaryl-CoA lyase